MLVDWSLSQLCEWEGLFVLQTNGCVCSAIELRREKRDRSAVEASGYWHWRWS